MKLMIEDGQYG